MSILARRWSIDTKYYTADVNLWVSHSEDLLDDKAKAQALAAGSDALVLVFDLSEVRHTACFHTCLPDSSKMFMDL